MGGTQKSQNLRENLRQYLSQLSARAVTNRRLAQAAMPCPTKPARL